ncbi:MAG: ParB N-terminal domain-containing protein [Eggerthellaceae bacterium]|nr:ParB N-terminal domain-containing protein [Eggerthellaceae bacterium]
MASNFAKKRNKIRQKELDKQIVELESPEAPSAPIDIQQIAFDNRINPDADAAAKVVSRQTRDELFTRHFRWLDVRELTPNRENYFDIDDENIAAFADLILETGNTDPLIVRETEVDGKDIIEIVDGERRMLAHMRLGETVDEKWYMVPTRYYQKGELSDAQAKYLLSAENLGQRKMSESNRMAAFAAVADRLIERRAAGDPEASKANIKDMLASQFNVSPRTAAMNINIGQHLSDRGMRMLDEKKITKAAADAIASLPETQQNDLLDLIEEGSVPKSEAEDAAREMSVKRKYTPRTKSAPSFDGYVSSAIRSLKRALAIGGTAQRKDIAAIKDLLDMMDPDIPSD